MSEPPQDVSNTTAPPATDADSPTDEADKIDTTYSDIRKARRRRAIGAASLITFVGFLFAQALNAVGLLDQDLTTGFFIESLQDFFPVTQYQLPLSDVGVPFIDLGEYYSYISEENLLYDPAVGDLLLSGQLQTFFIEELGMFTVFGEAGDTIAIGFAGTLIGFPLALLFGVMGSERVTPFPFNFIFRGTMSMIRSIPALVWVLILIPLGGITTATATLAVAIDTIGNLGRLFVDELEEIEDGPIEAMQTAGANRPQTVHFGMLSQVRTSFIAWTLYILEINVRIAVSLGVVGAGGLGQKLDVEQGLFNFTNAMAVLLCIFLLIISVELFSQRLRSRLRSDEDNKGLFELIKGFPQRMANSITK